MKIVSVSEKTIPIHSDMHNAVIDFSAMTISIVAIETDIKKDGRTITGYGFNSNGRYAQGGIIRERIIPRLLNAPAEKLLNEKGNNFDPDKCLQVMMQNEKPGGHGDRSVAVGTLDMALWDIIAKIEDKPLYRVLADRYNRGHYDQAVYVYAAGGYYYPGKDLAVLQNELKKYLDMGFTTCKIKIGAADLNEDLRRIESCLQVVGQGHCLAVDANGRFDLPTALHYEDAIKSYNLKWYEEAVDPLDYQANASLADVTSTALATGENIFSVIDTKNLLRYAGLRPNRDYLQMDPVLSYGLTEYLKMIDLIESYGWSKRQCIPHGGHQFGVHIAAGLGLYGNEAYPDVFVPFGKFARGMDLDKGKVKLTQIPGIGFEENPDIYSVLKK